MYNRKKNTKNNHFPAEILRSRASPMVDDLGNLPNDAPVYSFRLLLAELAAYVHLILLPWQNLDLLEGLLLRTAKRTKNNASFEGFEVCFTQFHHFVLLGVPQSPRMLQNLNTKNFVGATSKHSNNFKDHCIAVATQLLSK